MERGASASRRRCRTWKWYKADHGGIKMAAAQEKEQEKEKVVVLYQQGQIDALRNHYEQRLKEQADANRKHAEKEREYVLELQSRLLREQDRVARYQKKLLAIRDLFNLED